MTAVRNWTAVTLLVALSLVTASCEEKAAYRVALAPQSDYRYLGGGGGGGTKISASLQASLGSLPQVVEAATDRKIIRNASLTLVVNDVPESAQKITSIANAADGFIEKATQANTPGHPASITVRVPAQKLDQVMADVRHLATSVENESVEVRDVTREYIDVDAHLRNAKAEEAQYLQILKRAATIKDTLDVTEKLSDVRGRIEQLQGEMNYLSSQIEISTLEISLRTELETTMAGIHWRPLRRAKMAFGEMLSGLADWADSVIAFIVNLPLILVWIFSIVVLLVVAVRIIAFLFRRLGPKMSWRWPWRPASSQPKQVSE